jgi:hypothetical protein
VLRNKKFRGDTRYGGIELDAPEEEETTDSSFNFKKKSKNSW